MMLRGLAALDSRTAQWLLQYPSRSGLVAGSRYSGQHSRTSSLGRRDFTNCVIHQRAKDVNKSHTDEFIKRIANQIGSGKSLPKVASKAIFPTKELVLSRLKENLSEYITCSHSKYNRIDKRIAGWGIRGDCLVALQASKSGVDLSSSTQPPDASVLRALMQIWSEEALADLQADDSSIKYLDLENARHSMHAEGEESFQRLFTTSFLKWIESNLEDKPDAGQLVAHIQSLLSIVDARFPTLKFPEARTLVRQIHLHVGPTNSGKTHGALLALCKANTGIYAGPLRLLAHEVWERINTGSVSPGVAPRSCNLKTGEEMRTVDEQAGLTACTVEMVNYNSLIDVAVIDEIQMIGDRQRGQAWTNAVLGIPAKELHLCGENSVIPLIKSLAKACGDVVHVHEYKRLTPLAIGPSLDGQISNIQKGDCIVAFSRAEIFRLKEEIERETPFKCAVAYGALPPETKSEQAKKFNDPNNDISVMVASDAIGMGLNLKIKRIVFSAVNKWSGSEMIPVSTSQLKQIAGRAGRYGTQTSDEEHGGLATTFNRDDLSVVGDALAAPLQPITRAAVQSTFDSLRALVTTLPDKKGHEHSTKANPREFAMLLEDAALLSQINSRLFFAPSMTDQFQAAEFLEELVPTYKTMSISERELFAIAPANRRDEKLMALLANMVGYYARGKLIKFEDVESSVRMLSALKRVEDIHSDLKKTNPIHVERQKNLGLFLSERGQRLDIHDLMVLESLHRGLTLYLWFSFRLPLAFCYRTEVEDYKKRTEVAIDFCLEAIKAGRQHRLAAKPQPDVPKGRVRKTKAQFAPSGEYYDYIHKASTYRRAEQGDL